MKYRILLDEDIHKKAAEQLRLRGYDTIHVLESHRGGLPDEDQLVFAHSVNRILVSFNMRDYVKLHESFEHAQKEHSGSILSKQIPIGELIKKLAAELHERDHEDFRNSIYFL